MYCRSLFLLNRTGRESFMDLPHYENEIGEGPSAQDQSEAAMVDLDDPFAIAAQIERSMPEPRGEDAEDDLDDPFRNIQMFTVHHQIDIVKSRYLNRKKNKVKQRKH